MKKLFLASYFKDVASLFVDFANEQIAGKTITFIPTASNKEFFTFHIKEDKKALEKLGLIVDVLDISSASSEEIVTKLKNNDYIFIAGGNTFFLLQELIRTGADKIIKEQINSGKIYIGSSAGSVILAPNIEYVKYMDKYKDAKELKTYEALNIIDLYILPHLNNFPFKKIVQKTISEFESTLNIKAISNSQVVLIEGNDLEIKTINK